MSIFFGVLLVLLALLLALSIYRHSLLRQPLAQLYTGSFTGTLYKAGETYIGIRDGGKGSGQTIICMPGFLEDMRYFQALYEDTDAQLILINNADYHNPFADLSASPLDWENPFALGTIEHDAQIVGQVIEQLATESQIRLHGHSRGGAVVLEVGRLFPALVKESEDREVTAVLEAAVLPKAYVAGGPLTGSKRGLFLFFFPVFLAQGRKGDRERLLTRPMMHPHTPLKIELCLSLSATPKHYSTALTNIEDILTWQEQRDHELFHNYAHVVVLIGEKDHVLDKESMLASAQRASKGHPDMQIIQTQQTNHFISLERPTWLQELS